MAMTRTSVDTRHQPASGVEALVLSTTSIEPIVRAAHPKVTSGSDMGRTDIGREALHLNPLSPVTKAFDELVAIFPRVANLFRVAESTLGPRAIRIESELKSLKLQATALRSELLSWCSRQPTEIRPVAVQRFTQPYTLFFLGCRGLACPTFRADRYADCKSVINSNCGKKHYPADNLIDVVANMWTSYRQCQLHLANLVCRINRSLSCGLKEYSNRREVERMRKDIEGLIEETCASLTFMLAGENIHHCSIEGTSLRSPKPPALLGGLNMQWIVFAIATLENTPRSSREHARSVLSWFGEFLGIGQAKVLARVRVNISLMSRILANLHR